MVSQEISLREEERESVSPEMLDFVMRCLEKDQKKRFDCKEAFMHPVMKNVDLGLIVK